MNIKVLTEGHPLHKTGGEYTVSNIEIFIDPSLNIDEQKECVVHSILECYCPSWPHEKYDELGGLILEGLKQLD